MSEATEDRVKQESEGETIEAGYVGELEDLPFYEARHRAETAPLSDWLVTVPDDPAADPALWDGRMGAGG